MGTETAPAIGTIWLETTAAAERTGLPKSTFWYWARTGTGPIRRRRIGRRWLWLTEDLETALAV